MSVMRVLVVFCPLKMKKKEKKWREGGTRGRGKGRGEEGGNSNELFLKHYSSLSPFFTTKIRKTHKKQGVYSVFKPIFRTQKIVEACLKIRSNVHLDECGAGF